MTEYLLTPEEIQKVIDDYKAISDDNILRLCRGDYEDVIDLLIQAQLARCNIPARQREAVEMVFERIEVSFGGTKYSRKRGEEPYYSYEVLLADWKSLKAEILDKIK